MSSGQGDRVVVAGTLRDHPAAAAFAREVHHVHHRYATEVVGAFTLCPHMASDPDKAFGTFAVMLDRAFDVEGAVVEVLRAPSQVVHLVYPLITDGVPAFEQHGQALHRAVAEAFADRGGRAPVHAAFHPHMQGDATSASRLVGLLRQAPDPFVQFVPEGLHEGGTQYIDMATFDPATYVPPPPPRAEGNFDRLATTDIETIIARIAEIRRDRDRRYEEHLNAFA